MLELPEAYVIARDINEKLVGRSIISAEAGHSPHKWAWYYGDPAEYPKRLEGRVFESARSWGGLIEIDAGDARLYLGDGTNLRLITGGGPLPKKHQLRLELDDGSTLVGSVQMYGGLWACPADELPNNYLRIAMEKPSPYDDAFTEDYFMALFECASEKLSTKGFLATEQRIPGFGNGVLQDVLFRARLHPKLKLADVDHKEKHGLYQSVRTTLDAMRNDGGRDTEKMLDGRPGGYRTRLSKNTVGSPCPECGDPIVKASYLGGSVYFCPSCQPGP